jgi:hypothetical protein
VFFLSSFHLLLEIAFLELNYLCLFPILFVTHFYTLIFITYLYLSILNFCCTMNIKRRTSTISIYLVILECTVLFIFTLGLRLSCKGSVIKSRRLQYQYIYIYLLIYILYNLLSTTNEIMKLEKSWLYEKYFQTSK